MNTSILFNFLVIKETNQIKVERSFNAPVDLVWSAWTEAELLDRWWAPHPYKTNTKSMDFREGGRWLYNMTGPTGDIHWCLFDYEKIVEGKFYSGSDAFCDEAGNRNMNKPNTKWENSFNPVGEGTTVNMLLSFDSYEDIEQIIEMGFKEGFRMAMENLDQYIAAQFYLRRDKKPNNKARVTTYLNFPGNTEEAFLFYRSVFKTEFVRGIQRFHEAPAHPGQPEISEEVKNMVLHVELPITGGHILMATDAPKEFGFTVSSGNNMHISVEPESREEADYLFNSLSKDGIIEMPMQDMFFGAYFGSFKDKFGINWMINHQNS